MFSKEHRCEYQNNQLAEVICQLRFPDILTINANEPADFQDAIRSEFPQYATTLETPVPKVTGTPGNLQIANQKPTVNYQFSSADGAWRVNLTSKFISLTCTNYTNWESFAKRLDVPLAAFIKVYKPAYFQRIGLRYLNFISRDNLNLTAFAFADLIQTQYLGLLSDEEISETSAVRCGVDAEITIQGGCKAKIHAGPGLVTRNGVADKEVKFVFDQDLYMSGNIPVNYSAGALETLHGQAFPIFRGAITETLHEAMNPQPI